MKKYQEKGVKKCRICGSGNIKFFGKAKHTHNSKGMRFKFPFCGDYYRCNNCGLIFQHPLPSIKEAGSIYESENYFSFNSRNLKKRYLDEKKSKDTKKRLRLIEEYTSKNSSKTLIDIGSGYSIFVKLASERGWDALGIEPSKTFVVGAKKVLHPINLFNGYLSDYLKRKEKKKVFSAICLFDLIEHVTDPLTLIKDLRKISNDKSVIFILTPNANDFMVKHFYKDCWWALHPNEHLNLFTPKSMQILLHKGGFKIIKKIPFGTFKNYLKGFLLALYRYLIKRDLNLYQVKKYHNLLFKGSYLYIIKLK